MIIALIEADGDLRCDYLSLHAQFAMEPNFLHIWPRNTFMMIALPNLVSVKPTVYLIIPIIIYYSILSIICLSLL